MEFITITIVLIILALVPLYMFILKPAFTKGRRDRITAHPFPEAHEKILRDDFPQYLKLPTERQEELKDKIKIFLHEKKFHGCADLEVTEQMKVLIAAQACMLLLNRSTNFYPKLHTVNIYPSAYISSNVRGPGGVVMGGNHAVLGESWTSGQLVLAWDSSAHGASNMFDGKNVVYHEFAHQLDQEDGAGDGAPILEKYSAYRSWALVLGDEYQKLIKKKKKHRKTVLQKYGATNPAEFFAVATEAFFEKPRQLHKKHRELYDELKSYYKTDPLEWLTESTPK